MIPNRLETDQSRFEDLMMVENYAWLSRGTSKWIFPLSKARSGLLFSLNTVSKNVSKGVEKVLVQVVPV
jgi:hypothetical protein